MLACAMHRGIAQIRHGIGPIALTGFIGLMVLNMAAAQPLGNSSATTESSCNFGMEKDELKRSCRVPVPDGCLVANFPGTSKPWTNVSKGGNTSCQFNEAETDWKTRITGACGRCKTEHCSARFAVMFDCSANLPPPTTQELPRTQP